MLATEKAGARPGHHATALLAEADRLMTVCNSCRYCEGLCAVFPAMEMRRAFPDGDLNYLANLCHGCGACYVDCQFSPPHEFDVNVPRVLAQVRNEFLRGLRVAARARAGFRTQRAGDQPRGGACRRGLHPRLCGWHDRSVLFGTHTGPGAFYKLMPHAAMAWLFGLVFLYAIVALAMGVRAFWRDIGDPVAVNGGSLWQAIRDAATLRYLDGGGIGCYNHDERPNDRRQFYHHLTFYGFALCFASTCVATLYHYAFGRIAPYPWWDLPVVLGTIGGIGLIFGPVGLMIAKLRRDPIMVDEQRLDMDFAFLAMLFLTSLTGLLLLVLRATPAMPMLLALHLGVVFALFITMPYGKFVHGIYRFAALVRYAQEHRALLGKA